MRGVQVELVKDDVDSKKADDQHGILPRIVLADFVFHQRGSDHERYS